MANAVQILITAKDLASGVVKNMGSNVSGDVSSMSQNVEKGMKRASLALAAISVGLTAYAKNATDYMVETVSSAKALARQTGDTVENASRLKFAFEKMGLSADKTTTVFNAFSKQIKDANELSGEAALKNATLTNKIEATKLEIGRLTTEQDKNGDASGSLKVKIDGLRLIMQGYEKQIKDTSNPLQTLNVQTKNADGSARGFSEILLDVADRFKAMPDGVGKTNDALELFGRSGGEMVKILNKGRDGITELMEQADKLGLTITTKNIKAVDDYIASQKKLKDMNNELKMSVAELTTPIMTKYNEALGQVIQKLIGADAPTRELTANVLAFGGPIAAGASGLVGFAANLATVLPSLTKTRGAMLGARGATVAMTGSTVALAGGTGLLAAALSPVVVTLATLAAVGVGGYLVWNKYFKAHEDVKKSIADAVPSYRGYATSMDIVTAAQQNLEGNTKRVDKAVKDLADTNKAHADAQVVVKQRSDEVAAAQTAVTNALTTYGQNSPQYIEAVRLLDEKQGFLNESMYRELDLNLQLVPRSNDLTKARADLAKATWDVNTAQDYVNNGLDGSLGRIAQFGPTAMNQVQSVGVLQGAVGTLAGTWNNFVDPFGQQADYVNIRLAGNTKTAKELQSAITNINKASGVQFSGGAGNLQGARGFASGGFTGRGGSDEIAGVVHRGEYVLPKEQVNQATGQPAAQGNQTTVSYNGPFYFQTAEAVREIFALQDRNSTLASMGVSLVRP